MAAALAEFDGPEELGGLDGSARRAAMERAVADPALGSTGLYGRRVHWTEDPARVVADLCVATGRGARALVILPSPLDRWYAAVLEALAESGLDVESLAESHLDHVRALAARHDVVLDVRAPEAAADGLGVSLARMRDAAAPLSERHEVAEAENEADSGWFGAGVVASPAAVLRVGVRDGEPLRLRLGSETRMEAGEWLLDGSADALRAAADGAARMAFGRSVLGGYAGEALSRVIVDDQLLSGFTEELLEALEGQAAGGQELGAPAWAFAPPHRLVNGAREAMAAARKVGLEEGASLIHEGRSGARAALVFTNVEERMALARGLRAPCVLSLQRAGRG